MVTLRDAPLEAVNADALPAVFHPTKPDANLTRRDLG